jgi:hypothetical protein
MKPAMLPVVSTTSLATPVGVSIAILNGDHFRGIHNDASTTATSFISATTTNMSTTNRSTLDAGDDNNTNPPTDAEEEVGGNEDKLAFNKQFDDGGDLMPDDWTFPGFIAFALLGPIVPPPMIRTVSLQAAHDCASRARFW